MHAQNITFFEEADITDGALGGADNAEQGYIVRGGREMELTYEKIVKLSAGNEVVHTPSLHRIRTT
jgi:myosin-crossreactive antigen